MLLALGFAAAYGVIGIILAIAGYFLFDLVEWRINFAEQIKAGNMAVALIVAAFILGICFIVGRSIGA